MDIVLQVTFIFNAMFIKKKKKRKVSRMIRDNFTLECIRIFTTNIDKLFYVTIINSYLFTRVVRQTNGRICKMINTSLILLLSLINYRAKESTKKFQRSIVLR